MRVRRLAAAAEGGDGPAVSPAPVRDRFADVNFGAYHALVIGNNSYAHLTNLKTATIDAVTVAKILEENYGFSTTLLVDATRAEIIDSLARFRARLKFNDNLLIYYAGHGVLDEVTSQGYWLPVDAREDSPSNWISTGDVTAMVYAIRAKHVMVVADSCYSGTLVRTADAKIRTAVDRNAWVERMASKRSRTALVSGGLEPVLDSGGGEHSVFAKAFIDVLEENAGVIDGQKIFDAIKRPVVVNSEQTPEYSDIRRAGHDGGDFLFVRRK